MSLWIETATEEEIRKVYDRMKKMKDEPPMRKEDEVRIVYEEGKKASCYIIYPVAIIMDHLHDDVRVEAPDMATGATNLTSVKAMMRASLLTIIDRGVTIT
ncbi:MAG: hypothetical protein Q8K86_10735 [Candidatus Nanopelagicaceae bacterium]|nr:hypothetical protein [Candidatus Nanopelagicaceae bacterium]